MLLVKKMSLIGFSLLFTLDANAGAIGSPPNVVLTDPNIMVNLGDSITAGAFANTAADLPVSFVPSILNLVNLSELFTQNLLQTTVENKQLWSWASGIGVNSHFIRLKEYNSKTYPNGVPLQIVNMSVSGSVASDVYAQSVKISDAVNLKPETQISYITLFIGANDVCNGVPLSESSAQLEKAFDVLAAIPQRQSLKILVSSIPQIYKLGEPEIKNHATGTFGLSCEVVRSKLLKFCTSLTHWNNQDELDAHIEKVRETNQALSEAVFQAKQKHPNLDLVFSEAVSKQTLTFDILASDCFHPNIKGQEKLSEMLWNDQPWFK